MNIKKTYLITAAILVSIIALAYGVNPRWFAQTYLGLPELDMNIVHILRAVMGLYIACGLSWFLAAFNDRYRNAAILSTAIFAGGLVAGRIISYFADGQTAPLLTVYLVMELVLAPVALLVFRLDE